MKNKNKIQMAHQLMELWDMNEEHMGEMAAFSVSCEQLAIDEETGWELIALLPDAEEEAAT